MKRRRRMRRRRLLTPKSVLRRVSTTISEPRAPNNNTPQRLAGASPGLGPATGARTGSPLQRAPISGLRYAERHCLRRDAIHRGPSHVYGFGFGSGADTPRFQSECKNSKECSPAKHHFDECVERVTNGSNSDSEEKEDCVEECK